MRRLGRFTSRDAAAAEADVIAADLTPPVSVERPDVLRHPLVFSSPHSGRIYPQAFLDASRLKPLALRKSEDSFVEQLFAPVVGLGMPLVHARFPRAYLDVNREPYELDPSLFDGALPAFANTHSIRVVGGLGTIARIVTESEEIYRGRMPLEAAMERIRRLYHPYHVALQKLMIEAFEAFSAAVLIDCHSMPSNPAGEPAPARPDMVLGDRFGRACEPELTQHVARTLRSMGYTVALNKPYAGAFITEHYGRPDIGRHALQIEINRAIYMDEVKFEPTAGFDRLQSDLVALAGALAAGRPWERAAPRAAAE